MRIRNPRRVLLLGALLCSLAFVATAPQISLAKPYGWNDPDGPYSPPGGDGDGPVVKSGVHSRAITTLNSSEVTSTTATTTLKAYLTALRLGFGWRWIW